MKKIILLICMVFTLSFSSCIVSEYATTQDDIHVESHSDIVRSNVDINIVLTRGIPYYYEGSILYYIYNELYYYPFYYDNYWYMRVYTRPFNHLHYRPYFRPNRYDYRFNRDFRRPHGWVVNPRNSHSRINRPVQPNNRPTQIPNRIDQSRPNRIDQQRPNRIDQQRSNRIDQSRSNQSRPNITPNRSTIPNRIGSSNRGSVSQPRNVGRGGRR